MAIILEVMANGRSKERHTKEWNNLPLLPKPKGEMNLCQQLNVIYNSDHLLKWQTKILQPSRDRCLDFQNALFPGVSLIGVLVRSRDTRAGLYYPRGCSQSCVQACFQEERKLKARLAQLFISIWTLPFVLSFGNVISKASSCNSYLLRLPTIPMLPFASPALC